jgi:hypothetical protein
MEEVLLRVSDIMYELRAFEKRIVKVAFVRVGEEVTERWRKVQNEIFIVLVLNQILFHQLNQNKSDELRA